MLTPTEWKRFEAQQRRAHAIDERIKAVEAAIPSLLPPIAEEAKETLATLKANLAELLDSYPVGDVGWIFSGNPSSLTYDAEATQCARDMAKTALAKQTKSE